ncbi:hypothetical protein LAHI110946_08350 [Lactococcus hircilactis]
MENLFSFFINFSEIITILFAVATLILLICLIIINILVSANYKRRSDYE